MKVWERSHPKMRRRKMIGGIGRCLLVLAVFLASMSPAGAYTEFKDPSGNTVPGSVPMMLNGSGQAVPGSATKPATFTPLGCPAWQVVTTGAAVALSAVAGGIPAGATLAEIVPSVAVVKRDDGGAPTTTGPGTIIAAGMVYPSSVAPLSNLQFIAQTASGTISTCFYR